MSHSEATRDGLLTGATTASSVGTEPSAKAPAGVLFLPALRLPLENNVLRDSYRDAVQRALGALHRDEHVSDDMSAIPRLDIAVLFDGGSDAKRSELFDAFQRLLAQLYTLVCITASYSRIELDIPGGIDVRIFALDAPFGGDDSPAQATRSAYSGPLSSLPAFLASRTAYDRYCWLERQAHDDSFMSRIPHKYKQQLVSSSSFDQILSPTEHGTAEVRNTVTDKALSKSASKSHTKVAVGGTFDHLHIGHKLLLTATIFVAQPGPDHREITVGITGDELLVNKKYAHVLESWDTRQQRSAAFVESILAFDAGLLSRRKVEHIDKPGPNGKVVKVSYQPESEALSGITINYVQISDPFGPTITDESISALVISAETRAGGKAVNDKRTDKGWAPLEVFEVDVLDAGSDGGSLSQDISPTKTSFESKISSTEIRRKLAEGDPMQNAI